MSVTVDGIDDAIANIGKMFDTVSKETAQAIRAGALMVERDAVLSIKRGAKSGRVYKRGTKTHRASKAGEAPASDTGTLAASIKSVKAIFGDSWLVGSNLKYGRYLEHGTSKMDSRPWLVPALEKNRKRITALIIKSIGRKL